MVRKGLFLAAALVSSRYASAVTGDEAVSLVQHAMSTAGERPADSSFDGMNFQRQVFSVLLWVPRMWRYLNDEDGSRTHKCCQLAQQYHIVPFKSWGTIPDKEKEWWKSRKCTSAVGAVTLNVSNTLPNCNKPRRLMQFLRSTVESNQDAVPEIPEGTGCSAADRKMMNDTSLGMRESSEPPARCIGDVLMYHKEDLFFDDSWTTYCLNRMFGFSESCGRCFFKTFNDLDKAQLAVRYEKVSPEVAACNQLAMCSHPSKCQDAFDKCTNYVTPKVLELQKCIGGPTIKDFSPAKFFQNVIRFDTR